MPDPKFASEFSGRGNGVSIERAGWEGGQVDQICIALPVLAGERRAATLTPVGGALGEPGWSLGALKAPL
jgi:hypothetical protein